MNAEHDAEEEEEEDGLRLLREPVGAAASPGCCVTIPPGGILVNCTD